MKRAASLLLLLGLSACREEPATRGTLVSFEAVCDKSHEDKRVALEGYLSFPQRFKENEIFIAMRLRPALEETPQKVIGVTAKLGSQIEMPPLRYSEKDLRVHTADGKIVGYQDKVRVSGEHVLPHRPC